MTAPLTLQPAGTSCACVAEHRPPSLVFEHHHIQPQEFGGPTVPENMVYICATTHNNVHAYLRAFMRTGRVLSKAELRAVLPSSHYDTTIHGYSYDLACDGFNRWDAAGRPT